MSGWIKIHRKIRQHWLWSDSQRLKWWVDILIEANHEDKKVLLKGQLVSCKRGQCVKSLQGWAKQWRCSVKVVRTFFDLLKADQMIDTESAQVTTRLTVCNYETYQEPGQAEGTQKASKGHAEGTQRVHDIRSKELKKDKELSLERFEIFWNCYGKKVERSNAEKVWAKLTEAEEQAAIDAAPLYAASTPEIQYRKHPTTWLNGKCWRDEVSAPALAAVNEGDEVMPNGLTRAENKRLGML